MPTASALEKNASHGPTLYQPSQRLALHPISQPQARTSPSGRGTALSGARCCIHHPSIHQLLALLLGFERLDAGFELRVCSMVSIFFLPSESGMSGNLLGRTSSIFRGARLNGSIESLSRYELIVERSKVTFEVGRITGSSIRVDIRGSVG